jgi:hypothetical protein
MCQRFMSWIGGNFPTSVGAEPPTQYVAIMNTMVATTNKQFVAAHRTLPFGTLLNVCLRRHCVSIVVKDRGPFLPNMDVERRIDLSYVAAKALDMLHD